MAFCVCCGGEWGVVISGWWFGGPRTHAISRARACRCPSCSSQDPATCTLEGVQRSSAYPDDALRVCSATEAQLPALATLLAAAPQVSSYIAALRTAGLANIPGTSVTGEIWHAWQDRDNF